MPLAPLPDGGTCPAVAAYLAGFATLASRAEARSRLGGALRALLGMPPAKRPTRIGAKTLGPDPARFDWAQVTAADCAALQAALVARYAPMRAGAVAGAVRGVLRAAGCLSVAHLEALRVDGQAVGHARRGESGLARDLEPEPPLAERAVSTTVERELDRAEWLAFAQWRRRRARGVQLAPRKRTCAPRTAARQNANGAGHDDHGAVG